MVKDAFEQIERTMKEIAQTQSEILKWVKFASQRELRGLVEGATVQMKDWLIFINSDGEKTTREIGDIAKVNHQTVANCWKRWLNLGIVMESPSYKGRYTYLCSPDELGIDPPNKRGA